ncbi:hypothetical protein DFH08DRAFT_905031 [Mycena albidolilacea]|uniref:HNH nuclease domain-containing protein n=1 Tax=Mycena albidolilacea TaxID=1033008 RepID=A0AAD6Z093_9AGAR|nr:hypothetical protein DFH08DRAFT_905031 [Mycena albidolilacea]
MSSSHNNGESILALDGGVDDRDSASSSSSEGVDDPPAQAPSQTSQLYETPDTRSHTSSIGQRVKNKLTRLSGGRVCILTKESTPKVSIEAAHLVPRAASGTLLAKLEFSFGLHYKQLHIDTTGNLVYIRADLHRSFDNKGWLLLPETDVIKRIQTHKTGAGNYKQVFTETEFTYRIIPMQLFRDRTAVFQRVSPNSEEHRKIFPADPSSPVRVTSHVNPFFVVANAGAKIADSMALLPENWQVDADILNVVGIWLRWVSIKPSQEWLKRPRFGSRGNGGHGAGDGQGGQTGSGRDRDSPTPRFSRSAHFSASGGAGAGASLSRNTLACAAADLPQLDRDDSSDTTESDILTHDAVRAVGLLDHSDFLIKWLHGMGYSTSAATFSESRKSVRNV